MVTSTTSSLMPPGIVVGLVRAAGAAAAAHGRIGLLALGDLERMATAARADDVRVVDGEAGLEAVDEVALGALEVRSAVGIDDDANALELELVIDLHRAAVEPECVVEAREIGRAYV